MTKGAGAKSYMTKIFFPIYDGKFPLIFPKYSMTKISILGENSPQICPTCDENLRTREKFPQISPICDENFSICHRIIPLFPPPPMYENNF